MRAQPKLTIDDCNKIQTEFKAGTAAKALSLRFGISLTIIYKIIDGKYPLQIRTKQAEAEKTQEAMPDRVPLCQGCGKSSRVPCPICAGNDTVATLDVTG